MFGLSGEYANFAFSVANADVGSLTLRIRRLLTNGQVRWRNALRDVNG